MRIIESAFTDAVAALNLFESDRVRLATSYGSGGQSGQKLQHCPTCGRHGMPEHLERGLPFIYARTFLYALDSIGKGLAVLADFTVVPDAVRRQRDAFRDALPSLTPLRDSAQHIEDRGRGLARDGKPLDPKPVVNEVFHAPAGGILALDILNNDKFGSTTADGHYAEIEVSAATLRIVQACLQAVINALPWRGRTRQCP